MQKGKSVRCQGCVWGPPSVPHQNLPAVFTGDHSKYLVGPNIVTSTW